MKRLAAIGLWAMLACWPARGLAADNAALAAALASLRADIAAEREALAGEQTAAAARRAAARDQLAADQAAAAADRAAAAAARQEAAALRAAHATAAARQAARDREASEAAAMLALRLQGLAPLLAELDPPAPAAEAPTAQVVAAWARLLAHASALERGEFAIFDGAGRDRRASGLRLGWIAGAAQVDGDWQLLYTPADAVRPRAFAAPRVAAPASGQLTVDLTAGLARRRLAEQPGWRQTLEAGGLVIWPLLAIAILGALMVLERSITLLRARRSGARLEHDLPPLLRAGDHAGAMARLADADGPMPRVWRRGLHLVSQQHANLEEAMQEAVLSEIPPLERYLSTLAVFAAVAPLFGLLGTVSGMIETFDAISRTGGGSPAVLSGGISEALVSTWVGLWVAIPILLAHAVLVRQARLLVGRLDQAALLILESAGRRAASGEETGHV